MGKRVFLPEKTWVEIMRRHLVGGEGSRALAAEFGCSEAAIRKRGTSAHSAQVKTVANQLVTADANLRALEPSAQMLALDLAAKLQVISSSLTGAAAAGAHTAYRLSRIAQKQSEKVSEDEPMETQEVLQSISALTKLSNDAAQLGVTLLQANKGKTPLVPAPDGDPGAEDAPNQQAVNEFLARFKGPPVASA